MKSIAGNSNDAFVEMLNMNSEQSKGTSVYIARNNKTQEPRDLLILKGENDDGYETLSALLKGKYGMSDIVIGGLNTSMDNRDVYSDIFSVDSLYYHMQHASKVRVVSYNDYRQLRTERDDWRA